MRELFNHPGGHRNEAVGTLEILNLTGNDGPDSSPYPFNVMAIEALFQMVTP